MVANATAIVDGLQKVRRQVDALAKAALERLRAAVADKPVGALSLVGVRPADVVLVGGLVKVKDGIVASLVKGATNALAGVYGDEIYQVTEQVRHLLELVEGAPVTAAAGG